VRKPQKNHNIERVSALDEMNQEPPDTRQPCHHCSKLGEDDNGKKMPQEQ
jgi:hypothetical protein